MGLKFFCSEQRFLLAGWGDRRWSGPLQSQNPSVKKPLDSCPIGPWLAAGTARGRGLAPCWNVFMFPAQMVSPEEESRPVFMPLKGSCSQQPCWYRAWHPSREDSEIEGCPLFCPIQAIVSQQPQELKSNKTARPYCPFR